MFELEVVQAAYGDCFVLRYGSSAAKRCLIIDGGPAGNYPAHLAPLLHRLATEGASCDAVVLSHIDNDHVGGLLELFADVARERASGSSSLTVIAGLWHNAFGLSAGGDDLAPRVRAALQDVAALAPAARLAAADTLRGVAEGDSLRSAAEDLGIPINGPFGGGHILVDGTRPISLGPLTIEVVGPSQAILGRLRTRWVRWLRAHEALRATGAPPDGSIPNLSSIVLLVRDGDRSLLLTGDGRGDQIVAGLEERGLLAAGGTFHVDLLKVTHHGSARNTTAAFFRQVTADCYVVSADGRYDNPDLACLLQIVDAAREQGRSIHLVLTNETPASTTLRVQRPPATSGYELTVQPAGSDWLSVPIGPTTA